jgi:hypothetical protein
MPEMLNLWSGPVKVLILNERATAPVGHAREHPPGGPRRWFDCSHKKAAEHSLIFCPGKPSLPGTVPEGDESVPPLMRANRRCHMDRFWFLRRVVATA